MSLMAVVQQQLTLKDLFCHDAQIVNLIFFPSKIMGSLH